MSERQNVTFHHITASGSSMLGASSLDMSDIQDVEGTIGKSLAAFGLEHAKGLVQVRDAKGKPLYNFTIRKPKG